VDTRRDVWSRPFDLDRGTPLGELQRLTETPAIRQYASLSANGRYLSFTSDQSGVNNIWRRDLESGKESRVVLSSLRQNYSVISPSGEKVAYSLSEENDQRSIHVSAPGGVPEKLCDGCLRATAWTPDEKAVLIFGGNPYQVSLLDLASHQQTVLLKHPSHNLLYARFSPDGRWISFTERLSPNRGRIAIATFDPSKPVPESSWITVAEVGIDEWGDWSPDGKTLYFRSARDGQSCMWGQRLDPASHRPVGEPIALQHVHGHLSYERRGWAAAAGRLALVLVESRGNIWVMSRGGGQ
jgi:Tol biopolymer transport system component